MMSQGTGFTVPDIQSELISDERLLWSGKPRGGIRLHFVDAFLIPFTVVWFAFAAALVYFGIWLSYAPVITALFSIPFVSMGLLLLFGRFLADAGSRAKTLYAVTDQRILIVREGRTRTVQSTSLRDLPEITLSERKDGYGSIRFGSPFPYQMTGNIDRPAFAAMWPVGFQMIDDAREVYRIIEEAKTNLR